MMNAFWTRVASCLLFLFSNFLFPQSDQPVVEIPFELYGEHIFIKLKINDVENLDFIFDTGAASTVVSHRAAAALKLKKGQRSLALGASGDKRVRYYENNQIVFKGLRFTNQVLVKTSLDHLVVRIGRNIDGIIGFPLIKHFAVLLDFDRRVLAVYRFGSVLETHFEDCLDLRLTDINIPAVKAKVQLTTEQAYDGDFLVDTGAGHTVIINGPFSKNIQILEMMKNFYMFRLFDLTSKANLSYMGRVQAFIMGAQTFEHLPVAVSQAVTGVSSFPEFAGLLGNTLLRRFNLLFDLQNGKLYLKPNQSMRERFKVNCSGIQIGWTVAGSRISIFEVMKDSPAEKAGLKVSDKIIVFNGKWVTPNSLQKIKELLTEPGKRVSLVIRRAGALKRYVLNLRELI